MTETVGSLAAFVQGELRGDASRPITSVGDLRAATATCIGFLRTQKLAEAARTTKLGALLVTQFVDTPAAQILVEDVDVAFARIVSRFHPLPRATSHEVHATASVHAEAVLEAPVHLAPGVVVGRGARVGSGSVIGAGTVLGEGCSVGRDCVLFPRVVLYPGVSLGDRVIAHAGAVIGSDGFGYARDKAGAWVKWPHIGSVVIGDDVEIGANSTIDRGVLGITRIGRGTKLDNMVHVGHNCTVGEDVAIAALSAVAGSVVIGNRVQVGGHVVFGGHIKIADDVRIGGNSAVHASVTAPGDFIGYPVIRKQKWLRTLREIGNLGDNAKLFRDLQKRVAILEQKT